MGFRRLVFNLDTWHDILVKEYGFNFTYSLKRPKFKDYHFYKYRRMPLKNLFEWLDLHSDLRELI